MGRTQETGELKSTHKPSKAFTYFAIFVFVLFTAICGFIYFGGILPVLEGKANFAGDISILYWVMVFIMAMAVIILATALTLSKGKTYHLHEGAILSTDKNGTKTQLFEELDDIYLFSSGKTFITNNVAFRNRAENQWEVITPRYTRELKAIEFIVARHEAINVPLQMEILEKGGSVTYQYISYGESAMKKLLATGTKSFLKVKPKDIVLYQDRLIIDSTTIWIKDLISFSNNSMIGKVTLTDKNNKVVFSTATNGIFSGQTFIVLLDKLVLAQQQATAAII